MSHDSDATSRPTAGEALARDDQHQRALDHLRVALSSLRFGQVVITVQDGVVVQIDRTEKTRLR